MVRKELKKMRIDKELSQKEMAEKLGISAGSYCLIESGQRYCNLKTWVKIKDILNIPNERMWDIINSKA